MEKVRDREEIIVKRRKRGKKIDAKKIVLLVLNIALVSLVLFPIVYALMMAIKSPVEIYSQNQSLFPKEVTFTNFIDVFRTAPIARYIFNSFVVSIIITFSQVFTAMLAAFAFHFLKFRASGILFAIIMSTMMIPGEATIISKFLMVSGWGMADSLAGLVLPYLTTAMGIFLFRQAFRSFPMEIYEASKIDGCSNFRFVFQILIPLSRPTIGALSVSSFLGAWNMYMWPLLITGSDKYRTVQIGLSMLNSVDSESMVLMIAGVVVCMISSLIIFLFAQKNMIKGLTAGSVKG